jgi:hypothetical protein
MSGISRVQASPRLLASATTASGVCIIRHFCSFVAVSFDIVALELVSAVVILDSTMLWVETDRALPEASFMSSTRLSK